VSGVLSLAAAGVLEPALSFDAPRITTARLVWRKFAPGIWAQ
jgi:hypothetical protein